MRCSASRSAQVTGVSSDFCSTATFALKYPKVRRPARYAASTATESRSFREGSGTRVLYEFFRDLYRVRRSALADLVPAHEQVDPAPVLATDVLTNPTHQHVVLPAGLQRHREMIRGSVVDDLHPRRIAQDRADLI